MPGLPPEFYNPELMVIGDSMAQGCRSLSVNAEFCGQSWPARIAENQRWQFGSPDFKRPVLFDLEDEVRRLGRQGRVTANGIVFSGLVKRMLTNLDQWLADKPESELLCFDNLAISGAKIADLYTRTAASCQEEINAIFPSGARSSGPLNLSFRQIGRLHRAINGRFTLNPAQDPRHAGLSALDWVRLRKPRRLMVQIGHNHGFYQIGSDAAHVSLIQDDGQGRGFMDAMGKLAEQLAALPDEVGRIVFVLLPKLGAVANLMPQGSLRSQGYAAGYEPTFSISKNVLTGPQISAIDAEILRINRQVQTLVGEAARARGREERLQFLDAFALYDQIDFKNSRNAAARIVVSAGVAVDNRYDAGRFVSQEPQPPGTPPFAIKLSRGGFANMDGLHLSGCGYAYLAARVMELMHLPGAKAGDVLERGFSEDRLLYDYPLELDLLVAVLRHLRTGLHSNAVFLQPTCGVTDSMEDMAVFDALEMMKGAVLR